MVRDTISKVSFENCTCHTVPYPYGICARHGRLVIHVGRYQPFRVRARRPYLGPRAYSERDKGKSIEDTEATSRKCIDNVAP